MSLVPCISNATPSAPLFVAAASSDVADVAIAGNPVQLCEGGPVASSLSATDCRLFAPGAGFLRLGTLGAQNMIQIGPGLATFINVDTVLSGPPGTDLSVAPNNAITIPPGGSLTFSNAGAQRGTFRSVITLPTPTPDATTVTLPNPAGIVEGVYAIMMDSPAGDGQQGRQVSTVAYWASVGGWVGGAAAANSVILSPTNDRTAMTFYNGSGGALTNLQAVYVLLAGAA